MQNWNDCPGNNEFWSEDWIYLSAVNFEFTAQCNEILLLPYNPYTKDPPPIPKKKKNYYMGAELWIVSYFVVDGM